ncbi:unnamed protein product, partial [Rotaria magnacalcarata]
MGKNCISRIQTAAETARKKLVELIDESREKLSKTSHDLAVNIVASREANDYSENDFIYWKEQLNKLILNIEIIKNEGAAIGLIKVESSESLNKNLQIIQQPSILKKCGNFGFHPRVMCTAK